GPVRGFVFPPLSHPAPPTPTCPVSSDPGGSTAPGVLRVGLRVNHGHSLQDRGIHNTRGYPPVKR
ncbi:hypothetical protein NDU88_007174, partial [Pleurodeles waltl]